MLSSAGTRLLLQRSAVQRSALKATAGSARSYMWKKDMDDLERLQKEDNILPVSI